MPKGRLFGHRVLITRPRAQAAKLSELIQDEGGEPVELPTIRIAQPEDWTEIDTAARSLSSYDWAVFTSINGVRIWMERLQVLGLDASAFRGVKVAVIGPATAEELRRWDARVDLIPRAYVAESLLDELLAANAAESRLLLPRAAGARKVLTDGLRAAGADVHELALYTAVQEDSVPEEIVDMLLSGGISAVTFTSSSTVTNFVKLLSPSRIEALPDTVRVVCIGPVTAGTCREHSLRVDAVATEHTVPGLVEALTQCLAHNHGERYTESR